MTKRSVARLSRFAKDGAFDAAHCYYFSISGFPLHLRGTANLGCSSALDYVRFFIVISGKVSYQNTLVRGLDRPLIDVERKIDFVSDFKGPYRIDLFKWKVRNDNSSPQPRGEITDHRTRNNPESTKYKGTHFVECYAIRDGVCIARNKQLVVLRSV